MTRTTIAVDPPEPAANTQRMLYFSVAAAALGYFVDLFDIVIFGVVRVSSLTNLGLSGAAITEWGIRLLNLQMLGMLVGGFAWGAIGDRYGRRFALLATITVFSLANIANTFVMNVEQYAVLRFIAGFGLAGELGAGITLVSELLPQKRRGYGTTIVSFLGLVGALTASYVGGVFSWRTAYLVGGLMGIGVLLLRIAGMAESEIYEKHAGRTPPVRGAVIIWIAVPLTALLAALIFGKDIAALVGPSVPTVVVPAVLFAALFAGAFTHWRGFMLKFYAVAAVGVPIWFISALFVNLAPEYGKALSLDGFDPKTFVGYVLSFQAAGLAIGSALSGVASEWLESRKLVLYLCLGTLALAVIGLLQMHTAPHYAWLMFVVGLFQGYWTAFVTMAAEQFGADIRASVTTSAPNIVRAMTVPVTLSVSGLALSTSWVNATLIVGAVVFGLALLALAGLKETYGKDLDYTE
jgi:MFS transporter, putative metabolite:H+ symporter